MSPVYGLARARICTSWPSQHSRLRPLWGSPPATLSSPGKTRDVRGQREAAFSQARKWALGRWVLTSGTAVAASPLVASAGTAGSQQVLPLGLDPPLNCSGLRAVRCGGRWRGEASRPTQAGAAPSAHPTTHGGDAAVPLCPGEAQAHCPSYHRSPSSGATRKS